MMSGVACSEPSCHCSFETQSAMLQHHRDRHTKARHNQITRLPCLHCSRSFPTKGGLEDHRRDAHQQNRADASTAAAAAADKALAAPALALQDLRVTDDVACNDCGKVFRSTDSLHQHQWGSANHTRVSKSRNPSPGSCVRACSQCGATFNSANDLEQHFMSKHPICEVPKTSEEGTWQHVANDFISAWRKPTITLYEVHRVFKVYNTGRRRKNFEEYRKKLKREMSSQGHVQEENFDLHHRVLHNGNELQHYHGTTVKCRLGRPNDNATMDTTISLCANDDCNLCRILQAGFKKKKCKEDKFQRFGKGIYCSSISSKASEYVKCHTIVEENVKVMIACKVLVGCPFHSTRNLQELEQPPKGFHSVQGDPGDALNYQELVVYDDHAILPNFIILYSSSD